MNLLPSSFMIVAAVLGSAACMAAVEGEDWLPSPDDYRWPPHSKVAIGESKLTALTDFTEAQRKSLANFIDGIESMDSLSVRKADLNGDGVPELFIYQPAYSGTGGSVYEIVIADGNGYRSIGSVMGGIVLCDAPKGSKWLSIEAASRSGGGHMTRYLLSMVDAGYQTVRNEDHDYIRQIVTVRPVKSK